MNSNIYHERQDGYNCAIHTVNSIIQSSYYTKKTFEKIAEELYKQDPQTNFINPHKNLIGLGNYDINVIEKSLLSLGFYIKWFDLRLNIENIDLEQENLIGFIGNDRGEKGYFAKFFRLFGTNHWFAIRKINDEFYNLDSRLKLPKKLNKLEVFLILNWLKKNEGYIFYVYN